MAGQAFRDLELGEKSARNLSGICNRGTFGGKYLTHDVRVIRLPRHAAFLSCWNGCSCSADRNIKGKITKDGIFLEQLETNPAQYLPETAPHLEPAVEIDLNKPMPEILAELSKYPIKTRLKLNGTLIVARDIALRKNQRIIRRWKTNARIF